MEFIRGIHNLQPHHHGCVLTIGNFDGFHRGHQTIISSLLAEGRSRRLPVIVMIFEPQPQEYFSSNTAPARLTRLREKLKYLSASGVDYVVCVKFDKQFASLSASDFIRDLLVKKLGVHFISVGDDFRFGDRRQGDYSFLKKIGKIIGFEVMSTVSYTENGRRVSSTAIREALLQDHLVEAETLLGHPYCISGRVVHGNALGRTMGFPTANILLRNCQIPINGVYAVEVDGISNRLLSGIANIGTRPTIDASRASFRKRTEVHLFDININLYGYYIEVVIRAKVRNEKRFTSLHDLKQQISNDIVITRDYFRLFRSSSSLNQKRNQIFND